MPIRGGHSYRQHQSFKDAIRKRDNYTCQICGKYGNVVDHIIPFALSGETRPDGVRVLCRSCNLKIRRERKDANLPINEWWDYLKKELVM